MADDPLGGKMRSPFKLHDYQVGAVNAAMGAIVRGVNELVVLPTGSGKSVAIAGLVERLRPSPERRVLVLSHVREIIDQNATAIAKHMPHLQMGVCCSGLDRMEMSRPVTVGSVQTLYRRSHMNWGYAACIVDECHLIGRKDQTMYAQAFALMRRAKDRPARSPHTPIIGFTATPYRLDTGYLHRGPDALFSKICFDVPVTALVRRGVLAPLVTASLPGVKFNLPRRSGEFVVAAYTEGDDGRWWVETSECVRRIVQSGMDREHWVIFCCTVRHAEVVVAMLAQMSIRAVAIHNKTKSRERDEAIRDFRSGKLRALVNVNVLTTGFDAPGIDLIALLRPTMSTGLYVQMVGRGMRTAPSKDDCLVLDFGGNVDRHGALTDIVPESMAAMSLGDPVGIKRACPSCGTELHMFIKQCHHCGHLFAEIDITPSSAHILSPIDIGAAKRVPPSGHGYISSEEVAHMIGTTPLYVKQMRHHQSGPKFYSVGAMTGVGWRQIVYRVEDVERWMKSMEAVHPGNAEGAKGRFWRVRNKDAAV